MRFLCRWKPWQKWSLGLFIAAGVLVALAPSYIKEYRLKSELAMHVVAGDYSRAAGLYASGNYVGVVSLLEQQCQEYESIVEELGGWGDEDVHGLTGKRRAPSIGYGTLYCSFHFCIDYNSKYLPSEVEAFLSWEAPSDGDPYYQGERDVTHPWFLLSEELAKSKQPVLQAYGLWFVGDFEAYREFVYKMAEAGDPRFIGFAAHAARYDSDKSRALDKMMAYHKILRKSVNVGQSMTLQGRHLLKVGAFELVENGQGLNTSQKEEVGDLLDDFEVGEACYLDKQLVALFTYMGRTKELQAYEEKVRSNYVQSRMADILKEMKVSRKSLSKFSEKDIELVHEVLDGYLQTGQGLGYSEQELALLFKLSGREEEFKARRGD